MHLFKAVTLVTLLFTSYASLAEVAVIVNNANQHNITAKQVKKIFLGKTKSFPAGEKAQVFTLPDNTLDTEEFRQKALNKSNSQYKSYWAKLAFTGKGTPPKEVSVNKMLSNVKNNRNAIGFINSDKVTADVKVVATF